jgi:simple sugar transport system ATP-binding protein
MEKPMPDDLESNLADNLVEEESMRESIPPLTIPSSVSADTLR